MWDNSCKCEITNASWKKQNNFYIHATLTNLTGLLKYFADFPSFIYKLDYKDMEF